MAGWLRAVGAPDLAGMLRATRSGRGGERVYTLADMASDAAGNTAACDGTPSPCRTTKPSSAFSDRPVAAAEESRPPHQRSGVRGRVFACSGILDPCKVDRRVCSIT